MYKDKQDEFEMIRGRVRFGILKINSMLNLEKDNALSLENEKIGDVEGRNVRSSEKVIGINSKSIWDYYRLNIQKF
jgi:hypothetical protein